LLARLDVTNGTKISTSRNFKATWAERASPEKMGLATLPRTAKEACVEFLEPAVK
jgi:hypothetical protein